MIDIFSRRGEGATVKIRIPLTLAIIPDLIITTGGERFVIPQASLLELIRLEPDHQENTLSMCTERQCIAGREVFCRSPI